MHKKICGQCGKAFETRYGQSRFCAGCRPRVISKPRESKTCQGCGSEFVPRYNRTSFCNKCREAKSVKIRKMLRNKMCVVCGKEFTCQTDKAVTCSRRCVSRYWRMNHPKTTNKKCPKCGRAYVWHSGDANIHCCPECSTEANRLKQEAHERWLYNKEHSKALQVAICEVCGAEFKPTSNSQGRFCSNSCHHKHRHFMSGGTYRHIIQLLRRRLNNMKRALEPPKEPSYKKPTVDELTKECETCHKTFIAPMRKSRFCPECLAKEAERKAEMVERYCIECGEPFMAHKRINQKCCSKRCAISHHDKRLKDKIVDADITLEKLIRRDNGVCALCGEVVDKNDYVIRDNGVARVFIAGNRYPSIDHIFPVSQGGLHSWSNVQLAHMYCNSKKNDNWLTMETFHDVSKSTRKKLRKTS